QPHILARCAEVEQEPRLLVGRRAPPARLLATVDGTPGLMPWHRARRPDDGDRAEVVILEPEVGEPHCAPAPGRGADGELDPPVLADRATARRPPGKLDLAAPDPQGAP